MSSSAVLDTLHNKLNSHDVFALILPGFVALISGILIAIKFGVAQKWYECYVTATSHITPLSSKDSSLIIAIGILTGIFIASHAIGEILQALGHSFENIYWRARGGRPFYWIISERKRTFLPKSTIDAVISYLIRDSKEGGPNLYAYYPRVKGITYHNPIFRTLCERLSIKEHMCRGYLTLAISWAIGISMICVNDFGRESHMTFLFDVTMLLNALYLAAILVTRMHYYKVSYTQFLYEGFVQEIKKETESTSAHAASHELALIQATNHKPKGTKALFHRFVEIFFNPSKV